MSNPRFFLLCRLSVLALATMWGLSKAQAQNAAANASNPQAPAGTNFFRFDSALDAILAPDAKLEMLRAEGFEGGEGPVWVPEARGDISCSVMSPETASTNGPPPAMVRAVRRMEPVGV
jgi:hypothetical protein